MKSRGIISLRWFSSEAGGPIKCYRGDQGPGFLFASLQLADALSLAPTY